MTTTFARARPVAHVGTGPTHPWPSEMLEKAIALAPGFAAAYAALTNYLVSSWLEPKDATLGRSRHPSSAPRAAPAPRCGQCSPSPRRARRPRLGPVLEHEFEIRAVFVVSARAGTQSELRGRPSGARSRALPDFPKRAIDILCSGPGPLDPFHPPMLLGWLGHCHLLLDQPEQALACRGSARCGHRAGGRGMSGAPLHVPNWAWPTRHAPR